MSRTLRLDNGTAWPDPDSGHEAIERIGGPSHLGDEGPFTVSAGDFYTLRSIVGAYDHLARHPAGTESAVGSLRSLRRAVRGAR